MTTNRFERLAALIDSNGGSTLQQEGYVRALFGYLARDMPLYFDFCDSNVRLEFADPEDLKRSVDWWKETTPKAVYDSRKNRVLLNNTLLDVDNRVFPHPRGIGLAFILAHEIGHSLEFRCGGDYDLNNLEVSGMSLVFDYFTGIRYIDESIASMVALAYLSSTAESFDSYWIPFESKEKHEDEAAVYQMAFRASAGLLAMPQYQRKETVRNLVLSHRFDYKLTNILHIAESSGFKGV